MLNISKNHNKLATFLQGCGQTSACRHSPYFVVAGDLKDKLIILAKRHARLREARVAAKLVPIAVLYADVVVVATSMLIF